VFVCLQRHFASDGVSERFGKNPRGIEPAGGGERVKGFCLRKKVVKQLL
jgi:hypothetical protein